MNLNMPFIFLFAFGSHTIAQETGEQGIWDPAYTSIWYRRDLLVLYIFLQNNKQDITKCY